MSVTPHTKKSRTVLPVLFALMLLTCMISLMLGRIELSPVVVVKILFSKIFPIAPDWTETIECVVMDVRLPRIFAGLLVGAGLSMSGAAFQGVFRNPLVSPHILGVAAGSGFGAAIAILLFNNIFFIQLLSFLFGLIAVGMTYAISRVHRVASILMLVLSGIVVGSLFSALTSFTKYIADPLNKMPAIIFWLLGSLNNVTSGDLAAVGPLFVICMSILILIRWRINLLSMGDEDARALGVNPERLKGIIILCATVITAAAVCISGIIGWIGIVIPHVGRLIVGPDHKALLPASMLIGAAYLVMVDTVARTTLVTEIPIGILTAMIGAPVFAYLLRKNRTGW